MQTFIAKAENGNINWGSEYNHIRFTRLMQIMEGKKLKVDISEVKNTRSLEQNSYYWSCIVPAVQEVYNKATALSGQEQLTLDDTHELLKREFNFRYVPTKVGMIKIGRTTTNLSVGKFAEYIARIQHWADENGVYIPEADKTKGRHEAVLIGQE